MVLISLLEFVKFFCLNYLIVEDFVSLAEFLKGLQAAQGIISHHEHLQVVEKVSSTSAKKKKRLLSQRVSV